MDVKVLIQVQGGRVYITPLGLPFQVKLEDFERALGKAETTIKALAVADYNKLTGLASYGG